MSFRTIWQAWKKFWFFPQTPEPIALFRILLGLLILQVLILNIGSDFLNWYGNNSVVSFEAIKNYYWKNQPRFDLVLLFQSDQARCAYFYCVIFSAVCVTVGFATRFSSAFLALSLISMHHHMPYNINGGDAFIRLCSMFLACSNAGDCYSVDRWIAKIRNPNLGPPPARSPWALRLIQLQFCIVYWHTFACKIGGPQWWDGTAVYVATRLQDLQRFPLPLFNSLLFCKFLSWYTLVVEFSMWTFVWIKECRYPVLISALILHLGIDYAINLPAFEWAFIFALVTFVEPEDIRKCDFYLRNRFAFKKPVTENVLVEQVASE